MAVSGRTRARAALWFRIGFAFAGLVLIVVQALIVTKVVTWSGWVAASIAAGVGFVALVDNIRAATVRYRGFERNKARNRMYKPLIAALDSVTVARADEAAVRLIHLGASVYIIRSYWGRRFFCVPWRKARLHRIIRFRLSERPDESKVDWTKGKGTVGACWETPATTLHDRRQVAQDYGKGSYPTKETYAGLPDEVTCKFSYDEFIQTIDRYGEILAVPIKKRGGDPIGVVSIDCIAKVYDSPQSPSILGGDDIEEFAARAAGYISDDVAKF